MISCRDEVSALTTTVAAQSVPRDANALWPGSDEDLRWRPSAFLACHFARSITNKLSKVDPQAAKSAHQATVRTHIMTALTLKEAKALIASAEKRADEIGQPVNIAVVDAGGNLVAHVRQDGAWIGGVDISINKAWTSRAFDIQTKDLGENSQPNRQFYGIHATNGGRVIIFAGGVPLKRDGVVVGGLGVSGGSGEQDQTVAEAGLAAL